MRVPSHQNKANLGDSTRFTLRQRTPSKLFLHEPLLLFKAAAAHNRLSPGRLVAWQGKQWKAGQVAFLGEKHRDKTIKTRCSNLPRLNLIESSTIPTASRSQLVNIHVCHSPISHAWFCPLNFQPMSGS